MQNKKRIGTIVGIITILVLFIGVSFYSQLYGNKILNFVGTESGNSKALYVFITIFSVIAAPISTLPLVPLASHLWGFATAGILSIVGWVIGAQIVFFLTRQFGKPLVERIFHFKKLRAFENYFTEKNLFWTVVFLRIIIPVDILSYALGLFSKMKSVPFFFATLIGITPLALIFAYAGNLPIISQIIILIETVAVLGVVYFIWKLVYYIRG
ncbi:MAG: VTT domain-containing protein [Minisyncoccia bacterium]